MPGHLETLLAFDRQYHRDLQQSPAFLHRRDRRYALDQGLTGGGEPSLQHWLGQLQGLSSGRSEPSVSPELIVWRRLARGFVAGGALLGILTMSGLLFYEGGRQINVTAILGFILIQLLLALFTAFQGLMGWQPWAPILQRVLTRVRGAGHSSALRPLYSPLMARNAQAAGLAFGVTALLTLLISVVLQDLAFGWSTTLNTSAQAFNSLVSAVAAPWAGWLPAASPSLALVEETRFFRIGNHTGAEAARWGAWWPFLAMAWATWVILPRLALLVVAQLDLRRKSRRALEQHPGYPALLWRMETAAVDTSSDRSDSGQLPTAHESDVIAVPATRLAVSWAGADDSVAFHAGGNRSLREDRQTLAALAAERDPEDVLMVVTRSWEPPTAELADFLEDAANTMPGVAIALWPISNQPRERPDDRQLAQWLRFATRTGQQVRVAAVGTEEPAL